MRSTRPRRCPIGGNLENSREIVGWSGSETDNRRSDDGSTASRSESTQSSDDSSAGIAVRFTGIVVRFTGIVVRSAHVAARSACVATGFTVFRGIGGGSGLGIAGGGIIQGQWGWPARSPIALRPTRSRRRAGPPLRRSKCPISRAGLPDRLGSSAPGG